MTAVLTAAIFAIAWLGRELTPVILTHRRAVRRQRDAAKGGAS